MTRASVTWFRIKPWLSAAEYWRRSYPQPFCARICGIEMRLSDALRLATAPRLAFSGAGGKTTALFRLGREYLELSAHSSAILRPSCWRPPPIWQLNSYQWQTGILSCTKMRLVAPPPGGWPAGLLLFTGPLGQDSRTSGLSPAQMDQLFAFPKRHIFPLLVEADGSRQRPLKAPASHEPAIPAWVDTVVVVAGLSGLGRPLTAEWVHRPERFSELAGIPLVRMCRLRRLVRVLCHPSGGLQGIPESGTPDRFIEPGRQCRIAGSGSEDGTRIIASLSGGGDCFTGILRGGEHPRGTRAHVPG